MLVEISIVAGAALAGAAAIQHFYDRYHPRGFYKATRDTATSNAKAIHTSLEGLKLVLTGQDDSDYLQGIGTLQNALAVLPAQIEASVAGGIVKASTEVMKAQATMTGVDPENMGAFQAMGTSAAQDKTLTRSLKTAIGSSMLGPYAGVLEQVAPPLHEWLQRHPESVQWALEQPFVQGLIRKVQERFNSTSAAMTNNTWGT